MNLLLALLVTLVVAGCGSPKPTAQYPFGKMVDPVTEETPNVIIKR